MNVPIDTQPPEQPARNTIALVSLGVVAALVLVIGFLVWNGTRDEDTLTSPTTDGATTSAPAGDTTTSAPADEATTTVPDTSTSEATTTTEVPATTTTAVVPPSGATWTVTSAQLPDQPFEMARAAEQDGVAAYDGVASGDDAPRCVVFVVDGASTWQEWCGRADIAGRFVALDGIDPWIVEFGRELGDVSLTRQPPAWTLWTNGCTSPVATIAGTVGLRAQVTTGLVCVGNEAFVRFSGVLLQDGGPDGGGALLALGDEGWNVVNGGTSIPCDDQPDGVDRCTTFDVENELFEAVLPVPPVALLHTDPDVVDLRDATAEVRNWVGGQTDPQAVEETALAQFDDPDTEVSPVSRRGAARPGLALIVVDVPAFDDAVLFESWAIWVDDSGVVRALTWSTCARGVTDGLCV